MAKKPSKSPKIDPPNHLPEMLRAWRVGKRWAKKRVASEFGVTEATWSRWESGDRYPARLMVQSLSRYLRVPVCRFYCGAGPAQCPWQKVSAEIMASLPSEGTYPTGKDLPFTPFCLGAVIGMLAKRLARR